MLARESFSRLGKVGMLGDMSRVGISGYGSERQNTPRRWVCLWLWGLCSLVFAMVILGGATRLTGSGLSMVEWRLFELLPPLTSQEWQDMFLLYTSSPEYLYRNLGMTLDDFKGIFWLEYIHRLFGRAIGLFLFIPLVIFYFKGGLERHLSRRMITLFLLGGAQGLLGWFMVASGLIDQPNVSHYRLAAHLLLAVFLFAALLWTALEYTFGCIRFHITHTCSKLVMGLLVLTGLTMTWGAFVAGLDAGLIYNTFPLMDGQLIPQGLGLYTPLWVNAFENITAVQFLHRLLGTGTALATCIVAGFLFAHFAHNTPLKRYAAYLALIVVAQTSLGIATLLFSVPLPLGLAHQGGALILIGLLVALLFQIIRSQSGTVEMRS